MKAFVPRPFLRHQIRTQLCDDAADQLDAPIYTPLNITVPGKGIVNVPDGVDGIAFAGVTVQQPSNINDLALATLAGPVVVPVS